MDIGLHVASYSWPDAPSSIAPTLAELATTAEHAGFSAISAMDRFFQMETTGPDAALEPMLEGDTTLGYLAAVTEGARLGLLHCDTE